ncbi:MAG: aminotransferase class V [Verrucomicrobia bacterium]|nr:MAG: aminotransferase class V [Verrucomicrobiota bacterium]
MSLFIDESDRRKQFPVVSEQIFLAHAGVTALPACAAAAIMEYSEASTRRHQEAGRTLPYLAQVREDSATLIGAKPEEVALLGPTSLGLSLFANGINWREGDEILCYKDDYPANVYPWINLVHQGVKIRFLQPEVPGQITPELVASALSPKTRLVALASCHFLTGWRIDIDTIGQLLKSQGILFSLDAIQTAGAFPTEVKNVDFLSADAHKWMLGPLAIGIVFVRKEKFEECRPTLLGSWNVRSPNFIVQETIQFEDTARRYEPGALNITGIYGMGASLQMILSRGITTISATILEVRDYLQSLLEELGFEFLSPKSSPWRSGILTCHHPRTASSQLFQALEAAHIVASLRSDRAGKAWLRFSPHFYNTREEMDRVAATLKSALT